MDFVRVIYAAFGILIFLFSVYTGIILLYNLSISFFGFGKAKKDYDMIDDKARFLILIAAHNEETVIASTVHNLEKIEYDRNLFDIYVVNDNSTDKTEEECRRVGVKYINTSENKFPREGVGKPGALQYALRYLGFDNIKASFDLLIVLDADNHVDSNILRELNSQWYSKGKPTAIQAYLDSKNSETIVSLGYAVSYTIGNRFFQLAKYRLGLPNAIGGTGFAVTTGYLINSGGFNYKSLTEDLEMEIEIVENNGTILWNHFTRIYDEKPDEISASLKQRTRWMQGHWFVAFNNFLPLIRKFFVYRKWRYFDQLLYLFSAGKAVQMAIILISFVCSFIITIVTGNSKMFGSAAVGLFRATFGINIITGLMFLYCVVFQIGYSLRMDKNTNLSLKSIISLLYYTYTFLYCHIKGLLKHRNQGTWVKTSHVVKELNIESK